MKLILTFLILSGFAFGCHRTKLPEEQLTQISVVRKQAPKQTQPTIQTDTLSPKTAVRPAQNRFHIIVSSFKTSEKIQAEKLVASLQTQKHDATAIYSSQRIRVSIANFTTEAAANAAMDKYRAVTQRKDIWIYKMEP